jgi:hypothetical protein
MELKKWLNKTGMGINELARELNVSPYIVHKLKEKKGRVLKNLAKRFVIYTKGEISPYDIPITTTWLKEDLEELGFEVPEELDRPKPWMQTKKDSKKKKR